MKPVTDTCKPRPSIIQGTFNPEVFTASLGPVIQYYKGEQSEIDEIYTDASVFFRDGTYPTDGLKQTVSNVFRRIAGDMSAPSILRMETAFGGGKTHTLIACVHIANRGKEIEKDVSGIIDPKYLPVPGSVTVVGIAGDEIPVSRNNGDRLVPYTLWGELAYQVGGEEMYRKVQNAAEMYAAPGKDFLETVLGGRKVLIMLDELAQYAARLEAAQPNRGADQLAAFIMSLNGYAKTHSGISVIITLAGSADAFSRQTESLTKLLNKIGSGNLDKDDAVSIAERASRGVTSVLMRDATAVTPVQANEIAAVLAKRLFISIDSEAAEQAADEYWNMYSRNSDMFPEEASSVNFHDRMASTYPFHPTLIDFLNNKLATAENFQGTRGTLRVLAMTVRSIWRRGSKTGFIHVGDIDMQNSGIVDELLGKTGSADLKAVLNADIGSVGTKDIAGGLSNAQQEDRKNPHPDGMPLFETTWKVVFLNSLVGRAELHTSPVFGVSQQEATFQTATPAMAPAQVHMALDAIENEAFYLRYEKGKYFAHLNPTINSVLARIRTTIDDKQVRNKLDDMTRKLIQNDEIFSAEHRVRNPQDIPDKKEKLIVAVVSPDAEKVNIADMFTKAGDRAPRNFQNTLVLLVPKTVSVEGNSAFVQMSLISDDAQAEARNRLFDVARQVLAISKLESTPEAYGISRGKLLSDEFKERKSERNLALDATVGEMYTCLYYAGENGFVKKELIKSSGEKGAPVMTQIKEALIDAEELVIPKNDRFGASVLKSLGDNFFFRNYDHIRCDEILNNFYTKRHWPMIPNKQMLERLLREGVMNGNWVVYKMSEKEDDGFPVELYSQKKPLPLTVTALVADGYSVMTLEGAKKRSWTQEDRVPKEKIVETVRGIMQDAGTAYVKDIIEGVQQQFSNATGEQIAEAVTDIVRDGRYGVYKGTPKQEEAPEEILSGFEAYSHDLRRDDVIITKTARSERGWTENSGGYGDTGFTDNSVTCHDAKKILSVLKRAGSLYTRGASSRIRNIDIADLSLPEGATLRIVIDNAGPAAMKKLDEFFQIMCDAVEVTEDTDGEITIPDPVDGCAFAKAIEE